MEVGLIGVGRIGAGLLRRWQAAGHTVVAFDVNQECRNTVEGAGGRFMTDLSALLQELSAPRVIWLMLPAGEAVREVVQRLCSALEAGDAVIDGGDSFFKDSVRHAERLSKRGIGWLDVGVSGGVQGEREGYALMVGGAVAQVNVLKPLLMALARPEGLAHVGPAGSGHFVKMVHNSIEYGMMQAIGEGFDLLKNGPYDNLDIAGIADLWGHGTIIQSVLIELVAQSLRPSPDLEQVAAYIDDSGEGRWAVQTAVEHAVPFWVNTAALYARFDSRQPHSFAARLIARLRQEFSGYQVRRRQR